MLGRSEFVRQVLAFLRDNCSSDAKAKKAFERVLSDKSSPLGLLILGRPVNFPLQLAHPVLSNLFDEVAEAARKDPQMRFKHYVLMCSAYETLDGKEAAEATGVAEMSGSDSDGAAGAPKGKRKKAAAAAAGAQGKKKVAHKPKFVHEEDEVLCDASEAAFAVHVLREAGRQQTMTGVIREHRFALLLSDKAVAGVLPKLAEMAAVASTVAAQGLASDNDNSDDDDDEAGAATD